MQVESVGNGRLLLTILTPAAYQSGGPAPILPRYRSDKELSDMHAGSIHPSEGKRTPGSKCCPANSALVKCAPLSFDKPPGRHLRSVRTTRMREGYWAWQSFSLFFHLLAWLFFTGEKGDLRRRAGASMEGLGAGMEAAVCVEERGSVWRSMGGLD